ncbi:hypothetical protein SL949_11035 [Klebsiella pneumoniae]|uniref:hypothetical protein n=1 Tax=Klebsiella pneumoniae TaxID=573 RepID=UPI001D198374|nr:hypothetical protein [Klebsiella pneumoniae]
MKNDTDLPQSVTILEHVQKPTKQRFFVLGILFVSLSIIYLDRVNISIIAANTHFLNEMHLNDKPILVGLLMSLFLASYGIANVFLSPILLFTLDLFHHNMTHTTKYKSFHFKV